MMLARVADSHAYHLMELDIARSPDDPRRVMPVMPATCRRVLDVGCGAGQTLIASELRPGTFACGIDRDVDALRLGARLTPRVQFVGARGESLPFRSSYFDMVISRVALPWMHIPEALAEMARVLRPGGTAWLVLHPVSMALRELGASLRALDLRGVVLRSYILLNGAVFHVTGKSFGCPFSRQFESFQTRGGMRRALRAAGWDRIEIRRDARFFVVTARKPLEPR